MKRDIDELNLDSPSIGPISIMSGRGVLSAYDVTSKGEITAESSYLDLNPMTVVTLKGVLCSLLLNFKPFSNV